VAALMIILLLNLVDEVHAKKHESKFDKNLKKRKKNCQEFACAHIPQNYNDNCINQCISLHCFEKVYKQNPLEDGETDPPR